MTEITLLWLGVTIAIACSVAQPAAAHSVKHGDTIINYEELLGGRDGKTRCCDGRHCQAASAWWHDNRTHVWKFNVRWGTGRTDSGTLNAEAEVEVPDDEVTYLDIGNKGLAHWCGEFVGGESLTYSSRCAFVPLKASRGSPIPDPALRSSAAATPPKGLDVSIATTDSAPILVLDR